MSSATPPAVAPMAIPKTDIDESEDEEGLSSNGGEGGRRAGGGEGGGGDWTMTLDALVTPNSEANEPPKAVIGSAVKLLIEGVTI